MRKFSLVAAIAAMLAVAAPADAKTHRLRFAVTLPNANVLTNPPGLFTSPSPPEPGAYTFAGHGTVDGPGKTDGTIVYSGTAATPDSSLVTAILLLPKGHIMATGVATDDTADTEEYAITGGTRAYRRIRGDALLTNEKDSDDPNGAETFTLTLRY